MSILRDLQRNFKSHHLIALLGVVILIAALSQYSGRKGATHEGRTNQSANQPPNPHPDQEGTFAAESEEQRKRFYKQEGKGVEALPVLFLRRFYHSEF